MKPKPVFPDTSRFVCNDLELISKKAPSGYEILDTCHSIAQMLINKNISYGDSALNPVRIFSNSNPIEQLQVRIDDKLSRLMKGSDYPQDNDIDDLIGYLILLKIAKERYAKEENTETTKSQ
jgi:hypothetical protein